MNVLAEREGTDTVCLYFWRLLHKGLFKMNGAPSAHRDTHTQTHTTLVKCHFLNVPSLTPAQCCQSASCESCSCLEGISRSICKCIPLLYDVDSLAHISGRFLSDRQSEALGSIPPSIPIFPLIAFLHYITCPPHRPHNSSSFPLFIPPLQYPV